MPLRCRARFAFIEFSSETEAAAAIQKANGYKLDKAHTFVVNSFEDHAKYMAVPDEEKEFEPPPYVPKESLLQWMEDENARDQYVVRYNDETEIWWNDPTKPNPEHRPNPKPTKHKSKPYKQTNLLLQSASLV